MRNSDRAHASFASEVSLLCYPDRVIDREGSSREGWPLTTIPPQSTSQHIRDAHHHGFYSRCCRLHFHSVSRPETADKFPDASQYRLLITRERPVIGAVQLDESRLRDVAGEMPAGADTNGAVAATMQHQGRSGDSAQNMPHIRVAQCLEQALDCSRSRRGPQQACPPGSRPRIANEARRERFDAGGPAPHGDELLEPDVIPIFYTSIY